jgi:hypothetical protein
MPHDQSVTPEFSTRKTSLSAVMMAEMLYTEFKRTKMDAWEQQRTNDPSLNPPTQEQILQDWLEFIEKRAQMEPLQPMLGQPPRREKTPV